MFHVFSITGGLFKSLYRHEWEQDHAARQIQSECNMGWTNSERERIGVLIPINRAALRGLQWRYVFTKNEVLMIDRYSMSSDP